MWRAVFSDERARHVLITSRRTENLADLQPKDSVLHGLNKNDSAEFAKVILGRTPVKMDKLEADYGILLNLLDGHPLAMRVFIPKLAKEPARVLVEAFKKGLASLSSLDKEEERSLSLTVSMNYSFDHLSEKARKHLPLLSLFAGSARVSYPK